MPTRRLKKILIANRGEIACRVARACRERDIATVAVYSDADRDAVHVRMADEAVHIGPAPAKDSYLRVEKILDAAKQTGAEADAGLVSSAPPPSAITAMGGKTSARALMQEAGVPVVPGENGPGGKG